MYSRIQCSVFRVQLEPSTASGNKDALDAAQHDALTHVWTLDGTRWDICPNCLVRFAAIRNAKCRRFFRRCLNTIWMKHRRKVFSDPVSVAMWGNDRYHVAEISGRKIWRAQTENGCLIIKKSWWRWLERSIPKADNSNYWTVLNERFQNLSERNILCWNCWIEFVQDQLHTWFLHHPWSSEQLFPNHGTIESMRRCTKLTFA